jgi:hypothetical protein
MTKVRDKINIYHDVSCLTAVEVFKFLSLYLYGNRKELNEYLMSG